jgi:hypothetical protein
MLTASKSPLLRKSRFNRSPGPLLFRRMIKADPTVEGDIFSPTSTSLGTGSRFSPRLAGADRDFQSGRKRSNVEENVVPHPGRQDQMGHSNSSDIEASNADDWIEPRTVPGRLLHDIFVWVIIALEWTVYVLVLLVKMGLDLQEGKQGIM